MKNTRIPSLLASLLLLAGTSVMAATSDTAADTVAPTASAAASGSSVSGQPVPADAALDAPTPGLTDQAQEAPDAGQPETAAPAEASEPRT